MNTNIKTALVILGVILLGGFIVLAIQEPLLTEEITNEDDIVIEEDKTESEIPESENLVINQESEELINEESEKEESNNEENEKAEEKTIDGFIQCLKEKGVIIYGSEWCPYCKVLAEDFGGYEIVDPIYVECTKEEKRCMDEMIGRGVPEIQIQTGGCWAPPYGCWAP